MEDIFLESHKMPRIGHFPSQKTQAATTGHAHAHRPASSIHKIPDFIHTL
jgi:hypothetical protein